MKKLILAGLFSFMSLSAQAGILNVDLKKGTNYVNIKWNYMMTCGGPGQEYAVIYSQELESYVVGQNRYTNEEMQSSTPIIGKPPGFNICQAEMPVEDKARFKVLAGTDMSIEVVIPESYFAVPTVEVEHSPYIPLQFK